MTPASGRVVWRLVLAGSVSGFASGAAAAGRPVILASADGATIAATLHEAGARPAPGVVLVPMLYRTRNDWDGVGQGLAAAGITALAIDLRGHGGSSGAADSLPGMVQDIRAAVEWLGRRPNVRPDALGVAGASLGANLALIAAADMPAIRAVAAVSPSLDYRGVQVGSDVMRRIGARAVWLAASTEDPLALRTLKELTGDSGSGNREQYLSPVAAHGTRLLDADGSVSRALVDWLRRRLLF